MTLEIYNQSTNSWVNITPWIAYSGLTFSRNDVDSSDAGRDMSGLMHRGRVSDKEKMNVTTINLTNSQVSEIHNLLYPESFYVRVTPYPKTNSAAVFYVYSNNVKTSYVRKKANGEDLFKVTFPLIEN